MQAWFMLLCDCLLVLVILIALGCDDISLLIEYAGLFVSFFCTCRFTGCLYLCCFCLLVCLYCLLL